MSSADRTPPRGLRSRDPEGGRLREPRTCRRGLAVPSSRRPPAANVGRTAQRADSRAAASRTSTSSARPVSSPKEMWSVPSVTRAGNPVRSVAAALARSTSAGSSVLDRRGRRRAPPFCAARSAALTVMPSCTIRRASRRRASSSGRDEHRPRMPLAQVAAGEHPEHLLGQLEQAEPVRDRRLRASDALGEVAERQLELVDERRVRAGLLDRGELLAGDVLDQAEEKGVAGRRRRARARAASACPPLGRHASAARRR